MPLLKNCKFYDGVIHQNKIGKLITCDAKILFQPVAEFEEEDDDCDFYVDPPETEPEAVDLSVRSWKWTSLETYKIVAPTVDEFAVSERCDRAIKILNQNGHGVTFLLTKRNHKRLVKDLNTRMGCGKDNSNSNTEEEEEAVDVMMESNNGRDNSSRRRASLTSMISSRFGMSTTTEEPTGRSSLTSMISSRFGMGNIAEDPAGGLDAEAPPTKRSSGWFFGSSSRSRGRMGSAIFSSATSRKN